MRTEGDGEDEGEGEISPGVEEIEKMIAGVFTRAKKRNETARRNTQGRIPLRV
jgi:hypothetical protein